MGVTGYLLYLLIYLSDDLLLGGFEELEIRLPDEINQCTSDRNSENGSKPKQISAIQSLCLSVETIQCDTDPEHEEESTRNGYDHASRVINIPQVVDEGNLYLQGKDES